MIQLRVDEPLSRLLVVGCHPDDVEIGCGGTVLSLLRANPAAHVAWLVLAARGVREEEAREGISAFLAGVERPLVEIHGFRDGYLPYNGSAVKDVFEGLKGRIDPELILTHSGDDAHQDHRLASELTWNTFRDHLILEYEIPKWDGDLGRPNVYVPLAEKDVAGKIDRLERCHGSQRGKHWYDPETFRGLMRLRGLECGAPSGYAEAFRGRKISIAVSA